MDPKDIEGCTRIVGKSQGYMGLPLRDGLVNCTVNGVVPCMTSAWQPTPEELRLLNEGSPVYIRILGTSPPPMYVYAGEDNED